MSVDLPTPPLPEATQITLPTWAIAPSGRLARPKRFCSSPFSESESTSKATVTSLTPSNALTAPATAVWKWPRIGQPAVVSEIVTSTRPESPNSIERTIPSSTIDRRSSGSITGSSASRTCSRVGIGFIVANRGLGVRAQ